MRERERQSVHGPTFPPWAPPSTLTEHCVPLGAAIASKSSFARILLFPPPGVVTTACNPASASTTSNESSTRHT